MSELQVITTALERATRRRRWARALRGMWIGLLWGSLISLGLSVAYHLRDFPLSMRLAIALAPIPCMLLGLIIGGWRKPAVNEVARWVDEKQHLQQRLSTALEVGSNPQPDSWSQLVLSDAASHAKDFDARKLLPLHLPRRPLRWALVVLALCAGLGFVPEYRSKESQQKKADERVIKEVGKQLTELTKRSLETHPPVMPATEKSMQAVNELGEQLSKKAMTRSEALKDVANVAEKLKDELKQMGKDPALRKLEQAARGSNPSDGQTLAGMQKQMESLQKQIGTPTGNPDAMDKLQKDLEKAREMAQAMADKNGGSEEERQKLAESLSALSKQAQELGAQLPQLDQAIAALAANQPDLVLKDLDAATLDLEKTREMAKSLQQLQQQMEKMGKDLAEQLQNGQPEMAQSTLQKMIDQLKSAKLSEEQLKKMLEEVSKAVKPADNYGNVAEHLKGAAKEMQAGDKTAAAQSLAKAADELKNLMQQMGDAEAVQAALANLEKAQMCIGQCQGWGKCNNPGFNPKGGKPGSGVGTWGDPNNDWFNGNSERWDNSGINRPDMDGKGLTERSTDLNDALKPDKVKGQFSPGGQMPSITLKGVSIKGQSKVQYEEAAAAAQSEAQSALNQEKVPRAYQNSVKDYFDDIKK